MIAVLSVLVVVVFLGTFVVLGCYCLFGPNAEVESLGVRPAGRDVSDEANPDAS